MKTKTKSRCRNLLTRFDFWGQMHQCGVQRKSGSVQDSSDKTSFNNCMCNLRIALSCPCLSFPSEQLMIITVVIIYNDSMQHLFRLSSIVTVHVYTPFLFVFGQVFRYRWYTSAQLYFVSLGNQPQGVEPERRTDRGITSRRRKKGVPCHSPSLHCVCFYALSLSYARTHRYMYHQFLVCFCFCFVFYTTYSVMTRCW